MSIVSKLCNAKVAKRSKKKEKATMTILYSSGIVEKRRTYASTSPIMRVATVVALVLFLIIFSTNPA